MSRNRCKFASIVSAWTIEKQLPLCFAIPEWNRKQSSYLSHRLLESQDFHCIWCISCQPNNLRANSEREWNTELWYSSYLWSPRLVLLACPSNWSIFGQKDLIRSHGLISIEGSWNSPDKWASTFSTGLHHDQTIPSRENQSPDPYAWQWFHAESLCRFSSFHLASRVWWHRPCHGGAVWGVDRLYHELRGAPSKLVFHQHNIASSMSYSQEYPVHRWGTRKACMSTSRWF